MIALRNYTDTKNELDITQNRLNYLLNKKEELYTRYCGISSPSLSADKVSGGNGCNDKMTEYVHQITKVNPKTGLSLEDEIAQQQNAVRELKYYLNLMEHNLKTMKSIEYKLYYAIVVEAKGITGGIEAVSYDVDKDVSTIWKYYYPKIEKEIKKLEVK